MPKLPKEFDVPYLRSENDTKHAGIQCLGCGKRLAGSTGINNEEQPHDGAIAICWECGHVQAFKDPGNGRPMRYRELTPEEVVHIAGLPWIKLANDLRAVSIDRHAIKNRTPSQDAQFAVRAAIIIRKMRIALEAEQKELP